MIPSFESRSAAHADAAAAGALRVRRAYFECRFGQLHVHHVMPPGGGFDEATTVLCIPGAPGSGRAFYGLLLALATARSTRRTCQARESQMPHRQAPGPRIWAVH